MIQRINLNIVQKAASDLLKKYIKDAQVYSVVPDTVKPPFVFIELLTSALDANTKTSFLEGYKLYINVISADTKSKADIQNRISFIREIMTEDIVLEPPYQLLSQEEDLGSLSPPRRNPGGEFQSTITYTLKINYFRKELI